MVFNSLVFVLFLPIVFSVYWCLKRQYERNLFIILASYVFYGWWDATLLILIMATTSISYISGLMIDKAGKPRRKFILWVNVVINIGILITFKYFNFFVNSLSAMLSPLGIEFDGITLDLILPVGISFYTFQALGYVIDVYRYKIKPTEDISAFFAFISFFPQLVAGPIERASNLLPQFKMKHNFNYGEAVDGCRLILWGAFKKMVVADNCAVIVEKVFSDWSELGGANIWVGAVAFTFQIYGDFSGYSDMAIGIARLFGIRLMRNFKVPYFSRDLAEFWRRWHISLNAWFVEYVYIPLGGNRGNKVKTFRNVTSVFILSGLWHGASLHYIAWGGYHALLFIPLIMFGYTKRHIDTVARSTRLPRINEVLMMAVTFLLVMMGWVIFRSDNLSIAVGCFGKMISNLQYTPMGIDPFLPIWISFMLVVEWISRHKSHSFDIAGAGLLKFRPVRWTLYILIAFVCVVFYGKHTDFIYFQF